jgi:hypothetical protein
MAQFTRVNGDSKPVFHLDVDSYTNAGVNAVTSGVPVQPQGPKLDFFTVEAAGALTGAEVAAGIQTIQQLATIHIYEYTDAAQDLLAFAVYPVGAWSTGTLDTALQALGGGWAACATADGAEFGA